MHFTLIEIVGGGVQLSPLGTAATNRPIVPVPGDYYGGEIGGMMIGRGNRSSRRKPAPVPRCPPQTPHAARTRTQAAGYYALGFFLGYWHCGHSWPIVQASGDSEDDCGEADGM
jgi:hypothetical protein